MGEKGGEGEEVGGGGGEGEISKITDLPLYEIIHVLLSMSSYLIRQCSKTLNQLHLV